MELVFKESGRSARIGTRFHKSTLRVELTDSALTFCPTLLGVKCKELLTIPLDQIESVRHVNERGIPSFEVNAEGKRKFCWFDTTLPAEWKAAFSSAGVIVEHQSDPVPQRVSSDAEPPPLR
jgi:hypothetical protein